MIHKETVCIGVMWYLGLLIYMSWMTKKPTEHHERQWEDYSEADMMLHTRLFCRIAIISIVVMTTTRFRTPQRPISTKASEHQLFHRPQVGPACFVLKNILGSVIKGLS